MCQKQNSKKVVVDAKAPSIHENLRDNPGRVERGCYNASENIKFVGGRKIRSGRKPHSPGSDANLAYGQGGWRADDNGNKSIETQQAMDRSELHLEERSENQEVNDLVQRGKITQNPQGRPRWVQGSTRKQAR